jgi:hypothetical protein
MRSINLVSVCLLTASMVGCGLSSSLIPTVDNVPGDNDAAGDASDDVVHVFTNDSSDDVVISDDASDSMTLPCDDADHPVDAQDEEPVQKKTHLDSGVDASDGGYPVKDSGHDSSTYHDSGNGEDVSTNKDASPDASPDASECYTRCQIDCDDCKIVCTQTTSCDSDRYTCSVKCELNKDDCETTCNSTTSCNH